MDEDEEGKSNDPRPEGEQNDIRKTVAELGDQDKSAVRSRYPQGAFGSLTC